MIWGKIQSLYFQSGLLTASSYFIIRMPLDETVATYSYFIKEADKLGLAYIALSRHLPMFDPTNRGTPHDLIATYGSFIKKSKLFTNGGYTPEEAAKEVAEGKTQGVFFGFAYVTHPDVAERIKAGKALDNAPDFAHLYGGGKSVEEERVGYVDYPAAEINVEENATPNGTTKDKKSRRASWFPWAKKSPSH
jgi:2,4-dienoyl-CoA reductase-like NADH-dependent reductase (Old Yellow Enzyme family)